jgi:hypothetical protein
MATTRLEILEDLHNKFLKNLLHLIDRVPGEKLRLIGRAILAGTEWTDNKAFARMLGCSEGHACRMKFALRDWIVDRMTGSGSLRYPPS